MAVWQRGKWLLNIISMIRNFYFFLCETVPITMNSERYESYIFVINSYFLFHLFLTTIRLLELPDDIVFDFHEVYLILGSLHLKIY